MRHGHPCEIAAAHGLRVVEDAAHAVEADVRGRRVGAIGDFTCFSLYATKSLAGGEGGIVTTASSEAAERLRLLRAHGITRDPWKRARTHTLGHYDVVEPGSRPTWPTCRRPRRCRSSTGWRRSTPTATELVARYDAGLASLAGIEPIGRPDYGRHAHHLYVVRIDPARRAPTATSTRRRSMAETSPRACISCPCTRSRGTARTCRARRCR